MTRKCLESISRLVEEKKTRLLRGTSRQTRRQVTSGFRARWWCMKTGSSKHLEQKHLGPTRLWSSEKMMVKI